MRCEQAKASPSEPSVDIPKTPTDVRQAYNAFIKVYVRDNLGMVIGLGNVQGLAEERISTPELQRLSWLFADQGDAGAVGLLPVDFPIEGKFDAVAIDYGVLQYMGGDGAVGSLGREYRAALDALVITTKGGATKSKGSFSEE